MSQNERKDPKPEDEDIMKINIKELGARSLES
jgi:hypothetical protein